MRVSVTGRRTLVAALLGLTVTVVAAGSAGATGSFPGETLSLSLSGAAVFGKTTNFVASGNQTDVSQYNSGGSYSAFDLEVYAKDPRVDSTCAPNYSAENSAAISNPSETQLVIGQGQGTANTFSVPFKATFARSGPVLLCGYSVYITDTAATAQLSINVAGAGGGSRPTLAQRAKAACKAELKKKGSKKFAAKYGKKNALGRCISRYEHTHKA
jgi:hypothetical protein